MITVKETNIALMSEYLEENKKRNMAVDRAKITRLQNRAKHFDPLVEEEPQT